MKTEIDLNNTQRHIFNDTIREMETLPFTHPASVNINVAEFFYSLSKALKPALIVEIGCFIGFSTLYFAQALRENGYGRIISIDLFDQIINGRNQLEMAEYYKKKAGLDDVITYIKGESGQVKQNINEDINDKINLLYIDGDHTVEGCFTDFNVYFNALKPGGYILLHDINPIMCGWDGPRILINRLILKRLIPRHIELIELPTSDGYGIAILRKISKKHLNIKPSIIDMFMQTAKRKLSQDYFKRRLDEFGVSSILKKIYHDIYYKYRFKKNVPSNTVAVEITVKDKKSNKPIPNAFFIYEKEKLKTKTNLKGKVYFDHVLPNLYLPRNSGHTERLGYNITL